MFINAKPEFQHLSKDDVLTALDEGAHHSVAEEVARLVTSYTTFIEHQTHKHGYLPLHILRLQADCPIEEIAADLTVQALRDRAEND